MAGGIRETGKKGFTTQVCKAFMTVGGIAVVNHGSKLSSGVPDRTIICKHGLVYLEFKGPSTKISLNQTLWMERVNARYPSALVFRAQVRANPVRVFGMIQTPRGETLMDFVDPLNEPAEALRSIFTCLDMIAGGSDGT